MSEPHPQSSWQPVSAEEFAEWFDSDGRLVKEVTMRQRVFEGMSHKLHPFHKPAPHSHLHLRESKCGCEAGLLQRIGPFHPFVKDESMSAC